MLLLKNLARKNWCFFIIFLLIQSCTMLPAFSDHKCSDSICSIIELDSGEIACGLQNGSVEIFNGHHTRFLPGHRRWTNAVMQFDEKHLASASSDDNTIKIWNLDDSSCEKTLVGHKYGITSIIKLKNENIIASTSCDGAIKLWNVSTGECIRTLKGHQDTVYDILELSNGNLASASDDGRLKIWNPQAAIFLGTCVAAEPRWGLSFVIEIEPGILAARGRCWDITVWDFNKSNHASTLECKAYVNAICRTIDGNIAAALGNGTIEIWDPRTLHRTAILEGHKRSVKDVLMLDNNTLASSADDGSVKIWDLATAKCCKTLIEHQNSFVWKIFRLKKGTLVSVEGPRMVRMWGDPCKK